MSRYFCSGTKLAALEREMMAQPGFGSRRIKSEETNIRRGYSKNQVIEMGFPAGNYSFPTGSGEFVGKLVMKKRGKQNSLICYFDTEDGSTYKLCVWFNPNEAHSYRPRQCDLDISRVEIGTILRVTYDETARGKTRWLKAESLEVRENANNLE